MLLTYLPIEISLVLLGPSPLIFTTELSQGTVQIHSAFSQGSLFLRLCAFSLFFCFSSVCLSIVVVFENVFSCFLIILPSFLSGSTHFFIHWNYSSVRTNGHWLFFYPRRIYFVFRRLFLKQDIWLNFFKGKSCRQNRPELRVDKLLIPARDFIQATPFPLSYTFY